MARFLITILLFVSTALAATTTSKPAVATTSRPAAVAATKISVPRVLKPATPPTSADVTNSISNWMASVLTVNDYLNNPQNTTKLQSAIVYAKDEPVQLATLMKTTGLSKEGVNSAAVLMGNFPSIVSNLNSVQKGVMTTADGTAAINFMRCCTVLPSINTLWFAAANASKAATPMAGPALEQQCSQMSCASGASVNSTMMATGATAPGNATAAR